MRLTTDGAYCAQVHDLVNNNNNSSGSDNTVFVESARGDEAGKGKGANVACF